jgi:hypothetical protein
VKEVADRVPHGGLLEQAGGHLVEQRLKRVVVVLVDHHDLGVALPQLLRGSDAGKAATEHEDAGGVAHRANQARHAAPPPITLEG